MISKLCFWVVLSLISAFPAEKRPLDVEYELGMGVQPEIAVDPKGTIRVVYGLKNDKERDLYFSESRDGGKSFSKPYMIGKFSNMGLGMGRGPQLAVTKDFTVVTVGDHFGNMFALRLTNATNKWSAPSRVNDTDSTAKEALSGIAAGENNQLFTVWLDTRLGNNNLFGAASSDGGLTWGKNQLIFKGLQGGICDCCKPSVFVDKADHLNVMFRNKLDGARNMYLIASEDKGKHFGQAQKLGTGDFMINGCPMDGGDLTADAQGKITTVWRRQTDVYMAQPGSPETRLGIGRTPVALQATDGVAIAWEQNGNIQFRSPDGTKTISLGKGQYPKLALVKNQKTAVCIFERDGRVIAKSVEL